nr:hypothetical protein [uncultured Carboxylicivirga sp.]
MKSLRAGICKAGFLHILLFWGLLTVNAQYKVEGSIVDVGQAFDDVSVVLISDGINKPLQLLNNGGFITYLEKNKVYRFSFSKPGYVKKVIEFSTILPDNIKFETIQPYYLPVRLFKTFEGVDTVFFKQPVAKIRFDEELSDFADDRDYSLNVKYRIDKMREEAQEEASKPAVKREAIIKKESPKAETKALTAKVDDVLVTVEDKKAAVTGMPLLKKEYPDGRTDEYFDLEGREVQRTIFMHNNIRRVYLEVKHDWGGVFYFIDQAELGYRCISKVAYQNLLESNELNINKNK